MEIIRNTMKRLFAKKNAPEPSDLDALRLDFKERYHSFRLLLNANNRALEIMAELEQALDGEHPFGMTFVRSRCTAIVVNVFQMIEKLKLLAPMKYGELDTIFKEIKEAISFITGTGIWSFKSNKTRLLPLVSKEDIKKPALKKPVYRYRGADLIERVDDFRIQIEKGGA